MNMTHTLAKHRVPLIAAAVLVISLVLVPSAAEAAGGSLGLSYGTASGLGNRDIRATIAQIINVALSLLGIVALVIVLIGGFRWMTSGGSEDKVAEARKLIFSGIIGIAIILSAYAVTSFVLSQLTQATNASFTP